MPCSPVRVFHSPTRHTLKRIAVLPMAFALPLWIASNAEGAPDFIFHHGTVVTVDKDFKLQEAIAVEAGKISAVGSSVDLLRLQDAKTQVIDLAGKMVLPGLIDSHAHPADACLTEFEHEIPAMEQISEVLDYIAAEARRLPEGEWIEVRQIFITRLSEQRYPRRDELDRVAPRHAVIFATGPDASLNSLALQLSGIDRNFQVSDGGSGFVEKDPQSAEPTGILRNCTRYVKVRSNRRPPSRGEKVDRLHRLFADYNSVGITSICDRDAGFDDIATYREWQSSGSNTVRVNLSHHIEAVGPLAGVEESIRQVCQHALFREPSDWLRIIGIKVFLDGGMLTGSAYMRQPWGVSAIYSITDPAYRGVLFIPRERLIPMVRTAIARGLQFTAHAVGDGAVHALLDAYEAIGGESRIPKGLACISHSNFMSREAVEQAARLGVVVDIQPAWIYLDSHTLAKHFGYDRLRYFQPLQSLFTAGVAVGGGSDHMQKIGARRSVNFYDPFLALATAITRRGKLYGRPLHLEEALTRPQAIQFYTINNARVLGCEQKLGSLEVGKLADLIVLDRNLLTCPEEAIAQTRVLQTYVGGRLVYSRGPVTQ